MLYLTFSTISSVDLAQYGVFLAEDRVSVECGTNAWLEDDLQFYYSFQQYFSVSGRWADDNERLCAMEPRLRLTEKISPRAGLDLGTARSVGQHLTHRTTGASSVNAM